MTNLYDADFYAWTNQQAALLRAGKVSAADIDTIAEEIESVGRGERRELTSRLEVLLTHLLKWHYPEAETGLPLRIFPEECPWSFEQAMAPDFWPE